MNQNKSFQSLQTKERQIHNYSPCTIVTYCKLLSNLEKEFGKSLYDIIRPARYINLFKRTNSYACQWDL